MKMIQNRTNNKIAIILARGGSKRLPRKNSLAFGGKPMLAWTITAAIDSGCFDQVLVSTDDDEIAEISRDYGAEVPFLREHAADDHAPSSEATQAALIQAEAYWEVHYDCVAQLMANCPLRTAKDIQHAIRNFDESSAPAQISAFRFGWMNPWWAARLDANQQPDYLFPEARLSRSQDLPELYCPSGALWIADRVAFSAAGTFYMPGHVMHPMHWMSAMDIDDEDDLRMAQACLSLREL